MALVARAVEAGEEFTEPRIERDRESEPDDVGPRGGPAGIESGEERVKDFVRSSILVQTPAREWRFCSQGLGFSFAYGVSCFQGNRGKNAARAVRDGSL